MSKHAHCMLVGRGRNPGVSIESGSFSVDHFCKSVVCHGRCGLWVCMHGCGVSSISIKCSMHILAVTDN